IFQTQCAIIFIRNKKGYVTEKKRLDLFGGKLMIFITLSSQQETKLDYPNITPIEWVGYSFTATAKELWEHNLGIWKLGKRALFESYVALIFNGSVKLVAKIHDIKEYPKSDNRYYFEGTPLTPGDPIYDRWINKPFKGTRNPIHYYKDPQADGWDIDKDVEIKNCLLDLKKKYPNRSQFIKHLKEA
ncbi:hypothetical protein, partial [Liquorilactobacillus sp.]|uniref:hypothetical protein n=2 Tax=Liquorilactobacillus sp. TaxID=2767923 RepID=UPI0039EA5333